MNILCHFQKTAVLLFEPLNKWSGNKLPSTVPQTSSLVFPFCKLFCRAMTACWCRKLIWLKQRSCRCCWFKCCFWTCFLCRSSWFSLVIWLDTLGPLEVATMGAWVPISPVGGSRIGPNNRFRRGSTLLSVPWYLMANITNAAYLIKSLLRWFLFSTKLFWMPEEKIYIRLWLSFVLCEWLEYLLNAWMQLYHTVAHNIFETRNYLHQHVS